MEYTRPGKRLHNELERSTFFLMGKLTISMLLFNSKLLACQRVVADSPYSMLNFLFFLINTSPFMLGYI
jgi:hypothetical protein